MPLFIHFGDGGDYPPLENFRDRSGTAWEGLEADPGFDLRALGEPTVFGAAVWNRYLPTNPSVATPGAGYGRVKWPGTDGIDYRGTVPPQGVDRRYAPGPQARAVVEPSSVRRPTSSP
jgi:hypothetical protein